MKKQILISQILFSTFFILSAQWNGTDPIVTNSNVGIGATSPNGKLHITGTGSQDLLLENAGIGFSADNNIWADLVLARWENYFLDLTNWGWGDAADATVFRISAHQTLGKEASISLVRGSGGNLEFMDIYNNGYPDATQFGIRIQKRGTGEYNDFVFDQYDGTTFNPLMILKKDGNVLVGTNTNPRNYKLAVKGIIGAKEIKVELDSWSDFVFKLDYQLRTLAETEKYIKENGHLPDIPSAEEVEEEGISLGEMNTKLLQKIEEQTLYIIEMNKKIEELNQKIIELENKNN